MPVRDASKRKVELKLRDELAYQEVVNAFSELDVGADEPDYPEHICQNGR